MRRRLLPYFIVTVVPLTALAIWLAFDEGRSEEAQARAVQKAVVRVVDADLDRLFQLSRSVVAGLSSGGSDAEVCGSLEAWRHSFPEFLNVGIVELNTERDLGKPVCTLIPPATHGFPISPEEADLTAGLRTPGDLIVSPIRPGIVDGRPVIAVAGLLKVMPSRARRLVVASIDLGWLSGQLNRIAIPPGAVLLVLDRHGNTAARNPVSAEFAPGVPAPAYERTLPLRADFDGEVKGEGGIDRYYVLSRVHSADGLAVIMKIRSSDIFHRSRERLALHLAGLLAVSAMAFGLAWISTTRTVIRPVARLAAVADRLAAGDLSERTGLKYEGEIGRLARSFDLMSAALQRERSAVRESLDAIRSLSARLDTCAEEERSRVARDIHDELGQQLTVMRFELARLERDPPFSSVERIHDLIALVDETVREVGRIATELRPVALDRGGLTGAVEWLVQEFRRRTAIACRMDAPDRVEGDDAATTCLFRICQESLTNVGRHAGATQVRVGLAREGDWLTLTVKDNGRGFHPTPDRAGSLGILGMRERARIARGTLDMVSSPGNGTVIVARIPLRKETHAGTARAAALI